MHLSVAATLDTCTIRPQGRHARLDHCRDVVGRPAGLLLDQRGLVLVREEERRTLDERLDLLAVHARQLLRRISRERVTAEPALLCVAQHRLGIVRTDQHDVGLADAVDDRTQLDIAGLGHRARIEGRDLVLLGIRRADEARGVPRLGHSDAARVDVVPLQPGLVVGEVGTDRSDQHRAQAQTAHAERDVGGDTTPTDLEFVDQEGQRDLVQLVGDERVGEPTREGHEVIGRDGPGDEDSHGA